MYTVRTVAALLCVACFASNARAASPSLDASALSAAIDRLIEARWAEAKISPAPLADDAEFFRRLFLDLNGRIPPVAQLRDFLDDDRADKRRLWIDRLIAGRDNRDGYSAHLATFWQQQFFSRSQPPRDFRTWMRKQVTDNTPYDRLVRELLSGTQAENFYRVHDNQPERIAAEVSRLFLGIKLECAQCHDDRSGGRWKQAQFWELAAFFTPAARTGKGPAEIAIPDMNQTVAARFLDGSRPDWTATSKSADFVAQWTTAAGNPYFARAAANRLWAYFFGLGLVDPIDAGGAHNPPSHPELLDLLTEQFRAHDYDIQYLIRAITGSRAYQRSSAHAAKDKDEPRLFARMGVRPMTPEQLFDSVAQATGYLELAGSGRAAADRAEFLARFARPEGSNDARDTSIIQVLYLMNGRLISTATDPKKSKTLQVVAGAASASTNVRVREMYLATLSREPSPQELARLVAHVDRASQPSARANALADVLWVLLNSGEFMLNH